YKERMKDVLSNRVEGKILAAEGFGDVCPTYSAEGSKFVFVSIKSSDYFGPAGIYLYDLTTGKEKKLVSNVRSTIGWIPGQNKIVYAKIEDDNPSWYNVHDLYVYDIDENEETRLTHNLRANQPAVSHDGSKIVFLFQKDGTTNIGIVNIDGKNFKQLTFFQNGEQVYNPIFSPDDSEIIFDYSYHHSRDIAKVSIVGGTHTEVYKTSYDERNPSFDKDGNLVFASDETGIFNLYRFNLKTKEKTQLTNTAGGAFMPSVSPNGDILYAGYTSGGYKIFHIPFEEQK